MDNFNYKVERVDNILVARHKLPNFEKLTPKQRLYIYNLSKAALWGRDIFFDQNCNCNLRICTLLEVLYRKNYVGKKQEELNEEDIAFINYVKKVWMSGGIHDKINNNKIEPGFSEYFLKKLIEKSDINITNNRLIDVIINPNIYKTNVYKGEEDLVLNSACNFYTDGITQKEAEKYYKEKVKKNPKLSHGLNSTLCKNVDGQLYEGVWKWDGLYGQYIKYINWSLTAAEEYAENDSQKKIIDILKHYYYYGKLELFDEYSIEWVKETSGDIDFINGFIETYGDPLEIKGTWESLVEYRDKEKTEKLKLISDNAQWFEDNSPIDKRFKKTNVVGVVSNAVCCAMRGGELNSYSTAIGINLPNSNWIRSEYGSKSITITNLTSAYDEIERNSGKITEFALEDEIETIKKYNEQCGELHTSLHECLGHGSGQSLKGVSQSSLGKYYSVIEEARADLFALYYIADDKMVELGLLPNLEAHKSIYYTYIMNGAIVQLNRIKLGNKLEEAHMRNRALIANWCLKRSSEMKVPAVEMIKKDGKTYIKVNDYAELRKLFSKLLQEIQRIKSKGELKKASHLVEKYGTNIDADLHKEVLERYEKLNLPQTVFFMNPKFNLITNKDGELDVEADFSETLEEQMLRYADEYSLKLTTQRDKIPFQGDLEYV